MVNLATLAAVAAAGWLGGWEWILPCAILLIALRYKGTTASEVFEAADPGVVWVVLFSLTGNRGLYFPYSMQYAVQLACLLRAAGPGTAFSGGAGVILVFLAVRVWQNATGPVLLVELMAAIVILLLSLGANGPQLQSARRRSVISASASIAAVIALLVL